MTKQFVLKNSQNELIRFFNCESDYIYLVYRRNKKRLDFCSSPDFFNKESVLLIDEFKADEVESRPVPGMNAVIEPYSNSEKIRETISNLRLSFETDYFQKLFTGAVALYALSAFFIYNFQTIEEPAKREIAQQHLVELKKPPTAVQVKKVALNRQRNLSSAPRETQTKSPPVKKALKQMGALAVLGDLSKSEALQKGGLNFKDSKAPQGLGFQVLSLAEGSGGVQSQIYSKGMISATLGSGGNIRGGGGHGTKGTQKGGGSSGYGSLSLIGSGGDEDLSQSSDLSPAGKSLDFDIINREFLKKYALFRSCYVETLKTEPDLTGLFEFYFQINQSGQAARSRLSPSSPVRSQFLSNCFFKIINQMSFPIQVESLIELAYSFDLSELEN